MGYTRNLESLTTTVLVGSSAQISASATLGFVSSSRAQIESGLTAGSNFTITPSGTGDTRTFTLMSSGGGGVVGLSGDGINFIVVTVTSNSITNGTNLLSAYAAAKILTPNSSSLSATNRSVVLVPPGNYDLVTTPLTMDTQYVDLVGISGVPAQVLITSEVGTIYSGTLVQTANDVLISGVTLTNTQTVIRTYDSRNPSAYMPDSNLTLAKLTNVVMIGSGLAFSMKLSSIISGTFNNCTSGDYSFGSINGTAGGTYNNCTGGNYSFGGTASGTFNNCTGGQFSFGINGTASGTFNNCKSSISSFGSGGTATGIFNNCTAGDGSFGQTASGTFSNCTCVGRSFGSNSGTASGTFVNCTGGTDSFGGGGIASGIFINCIGGMYSFAGQGTLGGATCRLFFCRLTAGTFNTRTSGAKIKLSFAVDTEVNDA